MNIRHHHMLVDCLAHIINCKKSHLHTGKCFHFHACFTVCLHSAKSADNSIFFFNFEINGTFGNRQRMAHRYQIRGVLHRHDPGNSGNAKNVSLCHSACSKMLHDFCSNLDRTCCNCSSVGNRFIRDIHHNSITIFIKMA